MKLPLVFAASVLLLGMEVNRVWSSESDELHEKVKAMQLKADQLVKKGRAEEAHRLGKEAKELLSAARTHAAHEHEDHEREVHELQQNLKDLSVKAGQLKKANHKEALADLMQHRAEIEQKLHSLQKSRQAQNEPIHEDAERNPGWKAQLAGLEKRLDHARVAAENLHAAGLPELANEVAERAQIIERELLRARDHAEQERFHRLEVNHNHGEREHSPLDELRREVQQLRSEVKELRNGINARP